MASYDEDAGLQMIQFFFAVAYLLLKQAYHINILDKQTLRYILNHINISHMDKFGQRCNNSDSWGVNTLWVNGLFLLGWILMGEYH